MIKKYILVTTSILFFIFVVKFFLSSLFSPTTTALHGLSHEGGADYIFIGSSQTRQSLNPFILQDSLHSAYNVAYNGNSLPFINFIVDFIVTHELKVKKLIIEIYPYRLHTAPTLVDTRLFRDIDYKDKIKLLKLSKPFMSTWDYYDLIMLNGNESIFSYPITGQLTNSFSYRGGYCAKQVPEATLEEFNNFNSPYPDSTSFTEINSWHEKAIENIIKTAKNHDINVVFLEPAVPEKIFNSSLYQRIHKVVKNKIITMGYSFYDKEDYLFDCKNPAYFHDPVHLSSKGRDEYTRQIIKIIK